MPLEIVSEDFSLKLYDNPQFQKQQWVASYPHPVVGKLDQIGLLFSLSETPGVIQGRPLLVGEHTKEILAGMGYAEDKVKALEEQLAIGFVGMPRMPPRPPAGQAADRAQAGHGRHDGKGSRQEVIGCPVRHRVRRQPGAPSRHLIPL